MSRIKQKILSLSKNKEAKTLAGNFMWLAVLKIVSYAFPFITLPYLARVIGVDCFGEIAFAASIMVFIETFVDFGFNYTATRDIARQREDVNAISKIFSNVMWAKTLLMLIGFGILCVFTYYIPSLYEKRLLLFLTFLYVPGHIIFPDWFFQAMEKMKYITIMNVLSKLLFTILIFVVIREKSDYIWQPLLNAIGYWVSGAIAMWFIIKSFGIKIMRPKFREVYNSIKGSWNMFLSLLFPNLYTNFSTILLGSTCGEIATGLFDAGRRFDSLVHQFFQVLSRTFFPFLSRRPDSHKKYVIISGSLSIIACLCLYFSARCIINVFFTPEFEPAIAVIKILSISPFAQFLMDTYGTNYLILKGKENIYRNITIAFSIFGFITSILITPIYSYIGMAITIVSARLVGGVLTYIFAKRVKHNESHKNSFSSNIEG